MFLSSQKITATPAPQSAPSELVPPVVRYSFSIWVKILPVLSGFSPACWQSSCSEHSFFIQVFCLVLHLSSLYFFPVPVESF